MISEKKTILTETDKIRINELLQACRRHGDTGVPYPVDDEDCCHYLLWDGDDAGPSEKLLGVLGVFLLSDETAECISYVRPDERRRGLFSQVMFSRALDDFCGLEFVFPVSGDEKGTLDEETLAVLNSIGAEYDCTEYRMELTLGGDFNDKAPSDITSDIGITSCTYFYPPDAASLELSVSHCHVEKVSSDSVCLTDVETDPGMRNMGYGTAMMLALSDELKRQGIKRVIVHVSGKNLPAVSLYEKTGFRTTETLSYFIF